MINGDEQRFIESKTTWQRNLCRISVYLCSSLVIFWIFKTLSEIFVETLTALARGARVAVAQGDMPKKCESAQGEFNSPCAFASPNL
jgi:hypothetical protein